MNNDKWNYSYIGLLIFVSCMNILICINILPFDVWRVGNIMMYLASILLSSKNKKIKAKDRKMTIIGFITVFICVVTQFTALFKHMHFF